MLDMVEVTTAILPQDRPRYLMGVGTPEDLLLVDRARHRHVRLRDADPLGPPLPGLHLGRASSICAMPAMPTTPTPLDPESACPAAQYERAYLHHLVRSGETLGAMLLSYANVQFYQELMARAREAIAQGRFAASPTRCAAATATRSEDD